MADQIPYDNRIWDLTPAELKVAYLSLTLDKKSKIAERLDRSESAVGTHLTRIYEKLGLGAVDKDLKRQHLKENFGEAIEMLYALYGNDEDIYRERQDEALEKRKETEQQNQTARSSHVRSGMNDAPPEPVIRFPFTRVELNRRDIIMITIGFTAGVFLLGLLFGGGEPRAVNTGDPTAIFTNPVSPEQQALTQPFPSRTPTSSVSSTPANTPTTENTPTPTNTPTPEITPTPVPLPIREDFNEPIGPAWIQTGGVVFASAQNSNMDGVFTTRKGEYGSLSIGNTAWKNNVITFRAQDVRGNNFFELSFRVVDIDNRLAISCTSNNCKWIVFHEGIEDVIQENFIYVVQPWTVVVRDNVFTVTTKEQWPYKQYQSQMILPSEYEGLFDGGGVTFTISDMEVDYIEIQPFR